VKLSVIVPVFNEAPRLQPFLKRLSAADCPIEREFIFVDDGSRSASILASFPKELDSRIVSRKSNQGKGVAVKLGIREASGDYIMIQDADLEYDPNDVKGLLEPLLQDHADVVYGSRFKPNAPQVHRTYHYFINRFLTLLSNLGLGIYLTDLETCCKVSELVNQFKQKHRITLFHRAYSRWETDLDCM